MWKVSEALADLGAAGSDAGAAALAAASRGQALAQYRARRGLTRAEVAERMEVPADRVAGIERSGLAAAGIGELTRYIEAMGGRLEITADFGGDRIVLR
jgi:transcriptional regulator with XRE-family HTH domain